MIELEVKFTGGKNLSKIDWRSRQYMAHILPWAAKRIRDRVLGQGTTAEGRPLPGYGKKYIARLAKEGRPTSPVNYSRTGQMWRSLTSGIDGKGRGAVRFTGGHKKADGSKQTVKQRRKDGTVRERNLTNQMLASILAFRQVGKPMPNQPFGSFVPSGAFMTLDEQGVKLAVQKYSAYWRAKVDSAPLALP